jgi:hypothetical protein
METLYNLLRNFENEPSFLICALKIHKKLTYYYSVVLESVKASKNNLYFYLFVEPAAASSERILCSLLRS